MNEYDSILKEKKKTHSETPPQHKKNFPTFTLSFFATILVIIISYIIYYNTVLSKDKIIINNISILKKQYSNIISNLYIDNFSKDNLEGNITINNTLEYFFKKDNNNYYLNTPSLNKYINNNYQNTFKLNLEYLQTIDKNRYIKTFYFNDKNPIVETNIILSRPDLESMFGVSFLNEYEVLITCQNHAITNEIISIKITINNKITSERKVITFQNSTINYKDSENNLRFDISLKNNDFSIKIYKNDILHSVITGTEKINTYNYTYQIIDRLYTLNLITRIENDNKYIYEFSSNIEKKQETFTLILSDSNISNELFELIDYQELSTNDHLVYEQDKKTLLDFINKYKNNI